MVYFSIFCLDFKSGSLLLLDWVQYLFIGPVWHWTWLSKLHTRKWGSGLGCIEYLLESNHNAPWIYCSVKKLLSFRLHLPIDAIHGVYLPATDDHIRRISKFVDNDTEFVRLCKLTRNSLWAMQCSLAVAQIRLKVLGWLSVTLLEHTLIQKMCVVYLIN